MKRNPLILVVDNEEVIHKVFCRILNKERYTVLTTNSGKKALEIVDRERPDLVFLDLRLRDISGIEVLSQIKRINENSEVIIVTGFGTMKTARMAMRLGAYDYITKPFDIDYINALTKDVLSSASDSLLQKAEQIRKF